MVAETATQDWLTPVLKEIVGENVRANELLLALAGSRPATIVGDGDGQGYWITTGPLPAPIEPESAWETPRLVHHDPSTWDRETTAFVHYQLERRGFSSKSSQTSHQGVAEFLGLSVEDVEHESSLYGFSDDGSLWVFTRLGEPPWAWSATVVPDPQWATTEDGTSALDLIREARPSVDSEPEIAITHHSGSSDYFVSIAPGEVTSGKLSALVKALESIYDVFYAKPRGGGPWWATNLEVWVGNSFADPDTMIARIKEVITATLRGKTVRGLDQPPPVFEVAPGHHWSSRGLTISSNRRFVEDDLLHQNLHRFRAIEGVNYVLVEPGGGWGLNLGGTFPEEKDRARVYGEAVQILTQLYR